MANQQVGKVIKVNKNIAPINKSSKINSFEYDLEENDIISRYNESLVDNLFESKFGIEDEGNEDLDDVNNDSDTSTSFSLQECMNEFRARRIRRTSLNQRRQELEVKEISNLKNAEETTEQDLIKQNMCNKEQERKRKPCQNGFCYCFTSDSGDGGVNLGECHSSIFIPNRSSRRINRSEWVQLSNSGKRTMSNPRSKEENNSHWCRTPLPKPTCKSSASKTINKLKAISSLGTSRIDGPLIHIIQELRDNCVISTVKVNKQKLEAVEKTLNPNDEITYKSEKKVPVSDAKKIKSKCTKMIPKNCNKYKPTAPKLENILNLENVKSTSTGLSQSMETDKVFNCSERHRIGGGQLLYKRRCNSHLRYKPKDIRKPPQKPPRISINCDGKYFVSSSSTSSSVREAELVVDNFLAKKGFTVAAPIYKSTKESHHLNVSKSDEKVNIQSTQSPSELKNTTGKRISTYPYIIDIENCNSESKKIQCYDRNIMPDIELRKSMPIGWNDPNIKDMLIDNEHTKQREFHSSFVQPEPQQIRSTDTVINECGWQIPPKMNLDTVDGNVNHNLASNLADKNTPVKIKLNSPSQNAKESPQKQRFVWPGHRKYFSPWSLKDNPNESYESKKNMRINSKGFITSSKKRLMRLVSPKKENKNPSGIKMHNVAVQTSCNDIYSIHADTRTQRLDESSTQSAHGGCFLPTEDSYTERTSTYVQKGISDSNTRKSNLSRFLLSPPKIAFRSTKRKLNFPLNYTFACKGDSSKNSDNAKSKEGENHKTYRSYNSELDQDVSISKLSYILSDIRAKLEASDQQAVSTFLETNVDSNSGFDKKCSQISRTTGDNFNEPIYSEIEDDSVYISESPDLDNHTGIEHFIAGDNSDVLYTKVNKSKKLLADKKKLEVKDFKSQIPLSKIIHDSLKSKKIITNIVPLPTLPEPAWSESISYYLPLTSTLPLSHCQSLNNVQLNENNFSLKTQRNLSKSELSLHRSNFFLENLWKSELVIEDGSQRTNLEKKQTHKKNIGNKSYILTNQNDVPNTSAESDKNISQSDIVSYELPNDEVDGFTKHVDVDNSTIIDSNLGLSTIILPSVNNQSTPKKRTFVAEDKSLTREWEFDPRTKDISDYLYNSCPNTPRKESEACISEQHNSLHSLSVNEVTKHNSMEKRTVNTCSGLLKYKSLKNILNKSFRKSKSFLRNERRRLSISKNLVTDKRTMNSNLSPNKWSCIDSNLNLDALFSLNDSTSLSEQIVQTVSICRKLPDLKISMERVEAERLLLFSSLRRENELALSKAAPRNLAMCQKTRMCFFIDDIFLPVVSDVNQAIFFNYFYIITFECAGVIKSTQSAECVSGAAVFPDNAMEFVYFPNIETGTLLDPSQNAIKCNIFMLRLRKLSTTSDELKKKCMDENLTSSSTITSRSSSTSSLNEMVSRFRLYASFTVNAKDFVPYEYVHKESINSEHICVRASCVCTLPLKYQKKSNSLGYLRLKGRAEVRTPKHEFHGFLNVKDPQKQHNWNRRWCTLDGIFLYVWQDKNILNTSPLMAIDLRDTRRNDTSFLTCSREACARPRSFCLEYTINKSCENMPSVSVFFAADTQENLNDWLKNLRLVLDFIASWI